MQSTMKRIGALLLALAMLVTFMPTLGFAEKVHADEGEETITVYMTVSNKGIIASDKNGEAMAWKEVAVKDLDEDGKYSYDEALVAAHNAYFEGGAEAGYTPAVKKLWGVETTNCLFFIDGEGIPTGVTGVYVSDGDYLTASVNADDVYYGDWISAFDKKEVDVSVGESVELTLNGHLGMAYEEEDKKDVPLKGIKIGTWDDGEFYKIKGAATDEEGKVSLTFDEPGTYIVSANGTVRSGVEDYSSGLMGIAHDDDDNPVYGYASDDYMSYWIAYTIEDYGDGPYPPDEIIKDTEEIELFDLMDYDFSSFTKGHILRSGKVLADCPIIAPCCIVKVIPEPIEVSVTVSNKGVLASDKDGKAVADSKVTVEDVNADGKFTVDEALKAAHELYCPDGAAGYVTTETSWGTSVSRLWGVDTYSSLFFVNGVGLSTGVGDDTVEEYDRVYAALLSDEASFSDFYAEFDDLDTSVLRGRQYYLKLSATSTMGAEIVEGGLKGIQLGFWKDGKFEPIEGAVTDEDGYAYFTISEEGNYVITAQGTIKAKVDTDWDYTPDTEADCPIMAPYCLLEVYKDEDEEAAYAVEDAMDALPDPENLTLDDKDAVEKVRAMYEALNDRAKSSVYSITTLKMAEATIAKLEAEDGKTKAEAAQKEAEDKLKKAQDDLKAAQDATKAAEDKAAKADGDAKAAQDELKKAQDAQKAAEDAVKAAQAELDKAKASTADYDAQIAKLDDEIKELQDTIAVQKKTVKKVKAKAAKKKAKVSWKKLGAGYKYEVFKATKMNGKYKKAATAKKNKATVKKLKSKKIYYIKVRGFKTVGGKKVYTQFSDVVKVKAK